MEKRAIPGRGPDGGGPDPLPDLSGPADPPKYRRLPSRSSRLKSPRPLLRCPGGDSPLSAPAPAAPAAPAEPRPPQRLARVTAPLYEAVVSSEGGKLQEFTLKYRGEKPMVVVGELGPAGLVIGPKDGRGRDSVPMQLSAETVAVTPEQADAGAGADGQRTRDCASARRLTFRADAYAIDAHVRVENPSSAPRALTRRAALVHAAGSAGREAEGEVPGPASRPRSCGRAATATSRASRISARCRRSRADGQWIGIGSVWYMARARPSQRGVQARRARRRQGLRRRRPRSRSVARPSPSRPRRRSRPGQAWEGTRHDLRRARRSTTGSRRVGLEGADQLRRLPGPAAAGAACRWSGSASRSCC